MQTDDMCPGTTCFKVIHEENTAFERVKEDIERRNNYEKE
jgi:predicted metal-binding protein